MGQPGFLTIGNFSKLSRISIRSLRFYDEIQLLPPRFVDPSTGYRFYGPEQLREAEKIRLLRSLEVPLEDIRDILSATDGDIEQTIERHKQRVRGQIEELQRTLRHLDQVTTHRQQVVPVLQQLPDQQVLSLGFRTGLEEIEHTRERAARLLARQAQSQGFEQTGPFFELRSVDFEGISRDCLDLAMLCGKDEPFEVELAITVAGEATVQTPFVHRTLPGGLFLELEHLGPYEPLHLLHQFMLEHIQGQQLSFLGELREVYVVGPHQTPDHSLWITRVQYRVGPPAA